MSSLNLGQDVANKRERKELAAHIVAKYYPLYLCACKNASLRFSYYNKPLWFFLPSSLLDIDFSPTCCTFTSLFILFHFIHMHQGVGYTRRGEKFNELNDSDLP